MAAIRIYRRLQDQRDVDPNGLPDGGVPQYQTAVSSFVVETIAAGGNSFSLGASTLGNTLGDTGITGTRLVLAGIGRITLSQSTDASGGTITISGGTAGAGVFSGGVSDIGNTAGLTGITGTQVVFAGGNNITLSQSVDGDGGTITVVGPTTVAQSVQTQNLFDLTIDGNTAGAPALVSSGTLTLAGGSNITLSQNGNAISIIGGAGETQTAISGIANSETTYTSGTVNLSALGNLTIRSTTGNAFQFSVAPQSVQPETQTFIGGVAGSNTTYTSGTVNITGSGIVTVQSGTGQRIIINASQSVQPETQTFVGGIIASDTTYTSGSIRFTGVGGGVTVSSNTGQRVDISVAAPVAQTGTQFSAGLTNSGNTLGDTGTVGGRLLLVGTNNITLSGSTNGQSMTITMSGPTVGGAQTGISGIANSQTTYTSGTVSLSELGAITIRSTTGNQFQFSVNPQSVQPETQTFIGGIAASDTTYTSGTVRFTGVGGGITVSSNTGQRVDLSVAAQSAESQSFGMSNIGNTSGTTGIASGAQVRFLLAGGNNITLSQSLNGASGTITISAFTQSAESQSIGMSNIGNTSGTTGIASGAQVRFVFAGGNNVTLSQSLNGASGTITISGPNTAAQSNQTLGMYAVQNTTGQSSSTTMDARTLSVAGDGAVSVGYSAGSLRISAPVQTGTQFSAGISGGNTSGDTGTVAGRVVLAGGNNVTLSGSTNGVSETITISAFNQTGTQFSAGLSNIGNTSGDTGTVAGRLVFAGGNGITLSGSTNGASETITISGGAGGGFSAGVSNIGNTSGDTGITGSRLVLSGGQSITLSQSTNASGATVMISGASTSQSVQSLGMYAVQNTTGQSSSTTMDARTISVAGDGAASVGYSAGSLRISVPTQTVESQSIGMSNLGNTAGTTGIASGGQVRFIIVGSNNITASQSLNGASGTLSLSGNPAFSAGLSNLGNTGGATGVSGTRLVLVGSNNVTLSQTTDANGATVSLFGQAPAGGAFSGGASNLGNTAGATGITGTQLVLVGTNNITLSQTTGANGGTLSISGNPGMSVGVSTGGNTAGDTGVTGTRMVWVGSSPISLSQATAAAGGTITINAPATSSLVGTNGVSVSTNGSTISVMGETRTFFAPYDEAPMVTGQQGQQTIHVMPMFIPNLQFDRILVGVQISNATNSSNSITLTQYVGIYTKNASTISLLSSTSTSYNFSGSGTVGSYSLYGGPRQLSIPWTVTLTASDYFVALNLRSTTGGGAGHSISQLLQSKFTNSDWSGLLGAASTLSAQRLLGQGVYSATSAGLPNSMAFTDIRGTGSLVLRAPIFHLRSGTV